MRTNMKSIKNMIEEPMKGLRMNINIIEDINCEILDQCKLVNF